MSIAIYAASPVEIGRRIRAAKKAKGDTDAKVADALGISVYQLGQIERGAAGKRPSGKVERAIEALIARYGLLSSDPGAETVEEPSVAAITPPDDLSRALPQNRDQPPGF